MKCFSISRRNRRINSTINDNIKIGDWVDVREIIEKLVWKPYNDGIKWKIMWRIQWLDKPLKWSISTPTPNKRDVNYYTFEKSKSWIILNNKVLPDKIWVKFYLNGSIIANGDIKSFEMRAINTKSKEKVDLSL